MPSRNDTKQQGSSSSQTKAGSSGNVPSYVGEAPFTNEEKQYLKQHWDGEYHFLRQQQLSIYKGEDREEGRAIVRSFMKQDGL